MELYCACCHCLRVLGAGQLQIDDVFVVKHVNATDMRVQL